MLSFLYYLHCLRRHVLLVATARLWMKQSCLLSLNSGPSVRRLQVQMVSNVV